jgi:hypothetical protein
MSPGILGLFSTHSRLCAETRIRAALRHWSIKKWWPMKTSASSVCSANTTAPLATNLSTRLIPILVQRSKVSKRQTNNNQLDYSAFSGKNKSLNLSWLLMTHSSQSGVGLWSRTKMLKSLRTECPKGKISWKGPLLALSKQVTSNESLKTWDNTTIIRLICIFSFS